MRLCAHFMRSLATAAILVSSATTTTATTTTTTVWATPHDSYSSSIGVLGCKVNTNRIAYWPSTVDCNNICVSLSYGDRSVYLLRVDQSGGAYDVSYDAWNYLITGKSARDNPTAGGATEMQTENVEAEKCASLITSKDKKLPLSAANSMNYLNSCLLAKAAGNASWVADHYALFNILDPLCSQGFDETCSLDDWPTQNQANCGAHALGTPSALTDDPVYNIRYPTGEEVLATTGASGSSGSSSSGSKSDASVLRIGRAERIWQPLAVLVLFVLF